MTTIDMSAVREPSVLGDMRSKFLRWNEVPVWFRVVVAIGFLNFAAFCGMDVYFGGSALNGYKRNNEFYIGSHGRHTRVTGQFWTFSYVHGISVVVTHLSMCVGCAFSLNYGGTKK